MGVPEKQSRYDFFGPPPPSNNPPTPPHPYTCRSEQARSYKWRINPPLTPFCLNHSLCVNLPPQAQPNKGIRR
ncbi:hypothetical protein DJ028_11740 [Pseudomonas veronii]|nr:hypothetical protein DJ028_11740 [Pseudomonas veronii]